MQKHNLDRQHSCISNPIQPKTSLSIYIFGTRQGLILDIYIRLKYDHKKSSTDIYTNHDLYKAHTQDKMAEFLPGIAERMMQNSIYHLSPKFQLYFKIFKKKYRCLKIQILIDCTYHIMTGIFSYHSKSYRILQKLGMSILNNQTESASIQVSQ